MKEFFKKITAYTWAFIAVVVIFFTAGICSIGTPKTAGEALLLETDKTAYFSLEAKDGAKLGSVYMQVGSVYVEAGEEAVVTVKTSSSSSPSAAASAWSSDKRLTKSIANVQSESADFSGVNYRWIPFATELSKNAKTISVSASANMELNEIICFDSNGEQMTIKGYYKNNDAFKGYEEEVLAAAYDKQEGLELAESAYYNLTPEEGYYMSSVQTLLSGSEVDVESAYIFNENFNYLATLALAPSVAVFGASPFALRLPAFLATCVLIIFAYLLVKEFIKQDKYAFFFALILCVGGLATSLGHFGAPYALVASAIVVSAYFMARFYSRGISSARVVRGGMNIFLSGVFAAAAIAMDTTALLPVAGILTLFGFGLYRQRKAYKIALSKTKGYGEVTEDGEAKPLSQDAKNIMAKYEEKTRISYGFAALSFIACTAVLLLVSTILCYSAVIKANGNVDVGFVRTLWMGIKQSLAGNAVLPFGSANWSSVWAWWLPVRAATVYAESGSGYLAWNIIPNIALCAVSLLCVLAVTVRVSLDLVQKRADKKSLRIRRTYFLLLGGMAAAMLAGCIKAQVSPMYSLTFHVFYLGFLPLGAMLLPEGKEKGKAKGVVSNALIWAVVIAAVAVFAVSLPSGYGIAVSAAWEKWFAWTAFLSNGYFR